MKKDSNELRVNWCQLKSLLKSIILSPPSPGRQNSWRSPTHQSASPKKKLIYRTQSLPHIHIWRLYPNPISHFIYGYYSSIISRFPFLYAPAVCSHIVSTSSLCLPPAVFKMTSALVSLHMQWQSMISKYSFHPGLRTTYSLFLSLSPYV